MNLADMLKNINPQMLKTALQQMEKNLSPQQLEQVQKVLQNGNMTENSQPFSNLSMEDFQRELGKNPALAKKLADNPEAMEKIRQIFQK